jgi:hypothetical protein
MRTGAERRGGTCASRKARPGPCRGCDFGALQDETNRARDSTRADLRKEIARTQEAIEQAFVDGIIADQQRTELLAVTELDLIDVQEFGPRFE